MKRAYVTGSDGMLGRALMPVLAEVCDVRGTDLPRYDIRDADSIAEDIISFEPDHVFHLASMTDVDKCEKEPEEAYRSNVDGTRNVAEACRSCGAVMIYISTGMVYNGRKRYPYIEYDMPDPVNVYGSTKHQGELEIRKILKRFYIFNTCWIFGGGKNDKKFVAKIIDLARTRDTVKVVDDTFGSPTYTKDLAGALAELVGKIDYGRHHCVNRGCVNRYQLAKEILRIAGISGCVVEPVSSEEFQLPAPRPRMEAMFNYSLEIAGLDIMRDWRSALEEYISNDLG